MSHYKKVEKIDFSLMVPDYMEMFEVFSQVSSCPFNQSPDVGKVDLKKV